MAVNFLCCNFLFLLSILYTQSSECDYRIPVAASVQCSYGNIGIFQLFPNGKVQEPRSCDCTCRSYMLMNVLPAPPLLPPYPVRLSIFFRSLRHAFCSQSPRPCGSDLQKHPGYSKVLQTSRHEARSLSFFEGCTWSGEVTTSLTFSHRIHAS